MKQIVEDICTNKINKIAVLTHKHPDPDAIGAAVGLKAKFESHGAEVTIFYGGEISHPQNKTMVNVLSLDLQSADELTADYFSKFDLVVLVDCTEQNAAVSKVKADVIFDHHRTQVDKENYRFVDIRPVGSACALVYEALKNDDFTFDKESDKDRFAATAMLMGIKTDTNDLLSEATTALDNEAYEALSKTADTAKIWSIIQYPLPKYLFQLEKRALNEDNHKQINATYVVFIGLIPSAQRDALPILSEKFIRMEGVSTAVAFAIVDDNIGASVRSVDVSLDVDAFCKRVFGKDCSGGKLGQGGALVPLGVLGVANESEDIQKLGVDFIRSKIMLKIEGEAENT